VAPLEERNRTEPIERLSTGPQRSDRGPAASRLAQEHAVREVEQPFVEWGFERAGRLLAVGEGLPSLGRLPACLRKRAAQAPYVDTRELVRALAGGFVDRVEHGRRLVEAARCDQRVRVQQPRYALAQTRHSAPAHPAVRRRQQTQNHIPVAAYPREM